MPTSQSKMRLQTLVGAALLLGIGTVAATGGLGELHLRFLSRFSWFYLATTTAVLVFSLLVAGSSFGKLKLGPEDSKPEFSTLGWFSMILSAGVGTRIFYLAVSEPMQQLSAPAFGRSAPQEATLNAMNITMFHWGLHLWAWGASVGLCVAYFAHRHGLPLRISTALSPLFGPAKRNRVGLAIDLLVVGGSVLVVSSAMAQGIRHLSSNINYAYGIDTKYLPALMAIAIGLAGALVVAQGLGRGVLRLSYVTMAVAAALLAFVLVAGHTSFLLFSLPADLWAYLSYLPSNAGELGIGANSTEARWLTTWTTRNWAFALALAPCLGLFVARISRGRSIREFVLYVLLAPALVSCVWVSVAGGSAMHEQRLGQGMLDVSVSQNHEAALFELLSTLPWATGSTILAIACLLLTLAATLVSATVAMATVAAHEQSTRYRVLWVGVFGALTLLLLVDSNAMAQQNFALAFALPFAVLCVAMPWALFRACRQLPRMAQPMLAASNHEDRS